MAATGDSRTRPGWEVLAARVAAPTKPSFQPIPARPYQRFTDRASIPEPRTAQRSEAASRPRRLRPAGFEDPGFLDMLAKTVDCCLPPGAQQQLPGIPIPLGNVAEDHYHSSLLAEVVPNGGEAVGNQSPDAVPGDHKSGVVQRTCRSLVQYSRDDLFGQRSSSAVLNANTSWSCRPRASAILQPVRLSATGFMKVTRANCPSYHGVAIEERVAESHLSVVRSRFSVLCLCTAVSIAAISSRSSTASGCSRTVGEFRLAQRAGIGMGCQIDDGDIEALANFRAASIPSGIPFRRISISTRSGLPSSASSIASLLEVARPVTS